MESAVRSRGVLGVVQVGFGSWGRSWAEVVREAEGLELVAVVDPAPGTLRFAREALGLPPHGCHTSLGEALEKTGCDCMLVVTPPATHHGLVAQALGAGKHILVEKPLDVNLRGARVLVELANRAGRVLMVNQNYRFNAPFRATQELVRGGALGKFVGVRIGCRRDTRMLFPPGDFRYSMRHPYAVDMAVHHLDLLRAMTGREVRRIHGRSWRAPDSPFRHHPAVAALIDLEDGTPVVYEGTWAHRGPETGASDNLGSLAAMLGLVESIESGAPVEVGGCTQTASRAPTNPRGREQERIT